VRIEKYATNLQLLVGPRYLESYLAPGSKEAFLERVSLLRNLTRRGKKSKRIKWRFSIPREHPLRFKENGDRFEVDLAGSIEGEGGDVGEVNTLLRVWSLDRKLCYRAGIDSDEIRERIDKSRKRVIVRYHFDRRAPNVKKPEPIYHLQVGGIALGDENCWFPKQLEVPRFHFPPMDIILLCELVLVNFFHEQSENLRKKPEWVSLVRKSQQTFQLRYFGEFSSWIKDHNNTLLGHLTS